MQKWERAKTCEFNKLKRAETICLLGRDLIQETNNLHDEIAGAASLPPARETKQRILDLFNEYNAEGEAVFKCLQGVAFPRIDIET